VALYDALSQLLHSPVVELIGGRAGMAFVGGRLEWWTPDGEPHSSGTTPPRVRGDLLHKLAATPKPCRFERAASLTRNARERTLLLERAARARETRP